MGYATARAYFEQLPHGWASFPDCLALASLPHLAASRAALDSLDPLPPALEPILELAPKGEAWVPEVLSIATLLAVRDAQFGEGASEEEAFLGWLGKLNRGLLGEKEVVGVTRDSPLDVLPRVPQFWAMFHRGTPLVVVEQSANRARLVLTHPNELFHRINIESHRRTLALALSMSRAVQPRVDVRSKVSGAKTETSFEMTWL